MVRAFKNRATAGRALAEALARKSPGADAVVLGLPRGGVPVAAEIAEALALELDILNVRKLGVPWHPELALGAIAEDGTRILHQDLIRDLNISADDIEAIAAREQETLKRRTEIFRGTGREADIKDRQVILVDDGLATGATMEAAIKAVRHRQPNRVVVAVPVGPPGTARHFGQLADACICLEEPANFQAVGLWYETFDQVSDEEVSRLLQEHRKR